MPGSVLLILFFFCFFLFFRFLFCLLICFVVVVVVFFFINIYPNNCLIKCNKTEEKYCVSRAKIVDKQFGQYNRQTVDCRSRTEDWV